MLVHAQVIGQLVDAGSQDSDLNLGGTGVAFVGCVLQDNLGLFFLQYILLFLILYQLLLIDQQLLVYKYHMLLIKVYDYSF